MTSTPSGLVLECAGVRVVDTFAEAFPIVGTRLVITAATPQWAETAAREFCGFATSVIACDAEAAIERALDPEETPDGRHGVSLLAFAFSRDKLEQAVAGRVGQCVLTCPTTACYSGLTDTPPDKRISIGSRIRYFGDGFQISKKLGPRRFWRIPVMDGEFVCEDQFGTVKGVAGGNLLICGETQQQALTATEQAVDAMRTVPNVILPFPGGIVRSGSKVGSRYQKLPASTNDAYCPTLKALPASEIDGSIAAVYEIVIDGFAEEDVRRAMTVGLHAACNSGQANLVSAGNYGGKLGKYHFHLRDLLDG